MYRVKKENHVFILIYYYPLGLKNIFLTYKNRQILVVILLIPFWEKNIFNTKNTSILVKLPWAYFIMN